MTDQDDTVMGDAARADFAAEIERLRARAAGGPLDRPLAGVGIGTAVVGFVTCLVAYSQSTGFDDVRDQMESLILAMFGVGLVVFGSALYLRASATRFLRFWLLRLIYEQRDLAGRRPTRDAVPVTANHQDDDDAGDADETAAANVSAG